MAVKLRHSWLRVGGMLYSRSDGRDATRADSPPAAKPLADNRRSNIEVEDLKLLVEPLTKASSTSSPRPGSRCSATRRPRSATPNWPSGARTANRLAQGSEGGGREGRRCFKVEQKPTPHPVGRSESRRRKLADANAKLAQSVADSRKEDASVSPSAAPTAPRPRQRRGSAAQRLRRDKVIMQRAVEAAQKPPTRPRPR